MQLRNSVIKSYLQERALKKAISRVNRDRQFVSFSKATQIGLVCTVDSEKDWKTTLEFAKTLQTQGAKVWILGVFYGNLKPLWVVETIAHSLCSETEMNFYGLPGGVVVHDFIARPLDMLIDISSAPNFQCRYISALSQARFKVGESHPLNMAYYDYLLQIKSELSFEERLRQIVHYINLIHTNHE